MRAFLTACGLLLWATLATAGTMEVSWTASPGATGYKLYQSVDQGVTWTQIGDVTATQTILTLPDDKLVLVRVSAYNAQQEAMRRTSGFWYDRRQDISPQNIQMK